MAALFGDGRMGLLPMVTISDSQYRRSQGMGFRTFEKGVVWHDHVTEKGTEIQVFVDVHGNYVLRNLQFANIDLMMRVSRQKPQPLVLDDPFLILESVVLLDHQSLKNTKAHYGPLVVAKFPTVFFV